MAALEHSRKKSTHHDCRICSQREIGGAEVYEIKGEGGSSIFDVEKAKQTASDGRPAKVVSVEALGPLLEASHYEEAHISHVTALPGILGQRLGGPFLLDGIHRAVRCLHEGKDFHAFVLSQEETLSCLVLQDLWESNVGMVVRELRQLLENNPDAAYLEVKLESGPDALAQIRKLLTPEENARIKILASPH